MMWANVLGIYLLVGMLMKGAGMLTPGFRLEIADCKRTGRLPYLWLGIILGVLFWPIALAAFSASLRSKRARTCPQCGMKIAWMVCPQCGPLQRLPPDLRPTPETEAKFQTMLSGIDDPAIREAAVRARAEVERDPGLTRIRQRMAVLKADDPERKLLSEQLEGAAKDIFMRNLEREETDRDKNDIER